MATLFLINALPPPELRTRRLSPPVLADQKWSRFGAAWSHATPRSTFSLAIGSAPASTFAGALVSLALTVGIAWVLLLPEIFVVMFKLLVVGTDEEPRSVPRRIRRSAASARRTRRSTRSNVGTLIGRRPNMTSITATPT